MRLPHQRPKRLNDGDSLAKKLADGIDLSSRGASVMDIGSDSATDLDGSRYPGDSLVLDTISEKPQVKRPVQPKIATEATDATSM